MRPEREPTPVPPYQAVLRAYATLAEDFLLDPSPERGRRLYVQERRLRTELEKPGRFPLGQLVMTEGAGDVLIASFHTPVEFLIRHKHGDWGRLDPEDIAENERSVREGSRLLSSYRTRLDDKLWVITEWDRSLTTLLLPEEY